MSLDIKTVKNYAYSLFNQAKRESKENKVFDIFIKNYKLAF